MDIFHDTEDRIRFIRTLRVYSTERTIKIYHWVLMTNHFHLLVHFGNPREISSIMAGMARSYVFYHHRKYNSAGHLFQGPFRAQPVEQDSYLLTCGRYIERNPVKAGICPKAEDFVYSSARFYVQGKEDRVTHENPLFKEMGANDAERHRTYRDFLRDENGEEESLFKNFSQPVGSASFHRRLVKERGIFQPRKWRPGRGRGTLVVTD